MSTRRSFGVGRRLGPALAVVALLVPIGARTALGAAGDTSSLGTLVLPALGPGYAVLSQGPINPATFAADAPDPSAVSSALANLNGQVSSYQRIWSDAARHNAVQDMVFHFAGAAAAQVFLQSAQRSLRSGKIVTEGAVAGIPGAQRVTYFGATDEAGVGQAITFRAGDDVALLSFFSASDGNATPITQADATEVARSQDDRLRTASATSGSGVTPAATSSSGAGHGLVLGLLAAALVLAILVGVVLTRRRRTTEHDARDAPAA